MNMFSTSFRLAIILCLAASTLTADGVMRPTDAQYPKNFLRHRMTRIDVTLNGQIAVTKVYQEFVNEWQQKTNAVYSFPLPADARATDFFFWANDIMYQASLKVKEQTTNPGTGEGGIDALLNTYLGKNSIRVLVNDVPAGGIQKTQLEYISLCSYDQGRIQYRFPFNTQDFVTTPLESFTLAVHINASSDITESSVKEYSGAQSVHTDARHREMTLERSKIYPTTDLTVEYRTVNDEFNVEMYAVDNDTLDGHFVMIMKPQTVLDSLSILPKNVVFLLDCSISTSGTAFTASKTAVRECLKSLRTSDYFNIVTMNSYAAAWKPQSPQATASNCAAASAYLSGISAGGGSNLSAGLTSALSLFTSDSLNNIVLMFSDGQAVVDPKAVAALNVHKAGIFPIAIGENANRQRLEMIAYQNYGFPTFLALTDPLVDRVHTVFSQVNYPILKDVHMEFGSNVYDLLPQTLQTVYYGSRFYITGRYKNPATSTLSLAGSSYKGTQFLNFSLNFPSDKTMNKFAERFWAKEKIDAIERQIAVYGVSDSLKQLAIKYSLMYNIRCQYTAYLADKSKPVASGVETREEIEQPALAWSGNTITLSWRFAQSGEVAECNVYRSESPSEGFVKINAHTIGGTMFTDGNVSPAHVYYYKIEIVTRSGRRITSSVLSSARGALASGFALLGNYPNPFNPETSIRFTVANAGLVRIAVYDALGREVGVLVHERLQPGAYVRQWNAARFPSGVYYCRMTAGSFTAVQKLILQK